MPDDVVVAVASSTSTPAPAVRPAMSNAKAAVTLPSGQGVLTDCTVSATVGVGLMVIKAVAAGVVLLAAQGAAAATLAARRMVCAPGAKGVAAVQVTGTATLPDGAPLRPA